MKGSSGTRVEGQWKWGEEALIQGNCHQRNVFIDLSQVTVSAPTNTSQSYSIIPAVSVSEMKHVCLILWTRLKELLLQEVPDLHFTNPTWKPSQIHRFGWGLWRLGWSPTGTTGSERVNTSVLVCSCSSGARLTCLLISPSICESPLWRGGAFRWVARHQRALDLPLNLSSAWATKGAGVFLSSFSLPPEHMR